MARKLVPTVRDDVKDDAQWKNRGPHAYLAGQAHIDRMDAVAAPIEAYWGVGRLRLLVQPAMAAAFDSQRALVNQAIWAGDLDDLERECARMVLAWQTLDAAARAAGAQPIAPQVLAEVVVDGMVVAIVRDSATAHAVRADGRKGQVWTLDEVGNALAALPAVLRAKHTFPGAEVAKPRPASDPLLGLHLQPEMAVPPPTRSIGKVARLDDAPAPSDDMEDVVPF
jgi:hypothetical protein